MSSSAIQGHNRTYLVSSNFPAIALETMQNPENSVEKGKTKHNVCYQTQVGWKIGLLCWRWMLTLSSFLPSLFVALSNIYYGLRRAGKLVDVHHLAIHPAASVQKLLSPGMRENQFFMLVDTGETCSPS